MNYINFCIYEFAVTFQQQIQEQIQSSQITYSQINQMTEKLVQNKITGLMYRQEYSSHRQRLAHIKDAELSQFTIEEPYRKGNDYKKLMLVKMYQEKITNQNKLLQKKISQINSRNSSLSKSVNISINVNKSQKQKIYKHKPSQTQLQQQSSRQANQIKSSSKGFVLSQNRKKDHYSYSSYQRRNNYTSHQRRVPNLHNRYKSQQRQRQNKQLVNDSKHIKNHNDFSLFAITPKLSEQKDLVYYHEPQRYEQRTVMYKKTHIISSLQSCLVQISMVEDRLIIVGYLMGQLNETLKLFLTKNQTYNVLSQSFSDWEVIGSRVYIQNNLSGKVLKISPMTILSQKINAKQKVSTQLSKQMQKKQKQFIQRNYYSIIQKQKQKMALLVEQQHIQKQKIAKNNLVPVSKVVQRLARHKEYPTRQIKYENGKQLKQSKEQRSKQKNNKIQKNQFYVNNLNNRIKINSLKNQDKEDNKISSQKQPVQKSVNKIEKKLKKQIQTKKQNKSKKIQQRDHQDKDAKQKKKNTLEQQDDLDQHEYEKSQKNQKQNQDQKYDEEQDQQYADDDRQDQKYNEEYEDQDQDLIKNIQDSQSQDDKYSLEQDQHKKSIQKKKQSQKQKKKNKKFQKPEKKNIKIENLKQIKQYQYKSQNQNQKQKRKIKVQMNHPIQQQNSLQYEYESSSQLQGETERSKNINRNHQKDFINQSSMKEQEKKVYKNQQKSKKNQNQNMKLKKTPKQQQKQQQTYEQQFQNQNEKIQQYQQQYQPQQLQQRVEEYQEQFQM